MQNQMRVPVLNLSASARVFMLLSCSLSIVYNCSMSSPHACENITSHGIAVGLPSDSAAAFIISATPWPQPAVHGLTKNLSRSWPLTQCPVLSNTS